MMSSDSQYLQWFRQAAPYIHLHRGKTFVLLLSGETVLSKHFAHLVHDIALLTSLGIRLILVHGARPQIDTLLAAQKISSRFEQGLRITDLDTLQAVTAAAGTVRFNIESLLSMGLPNSPMHGSRIRVASGNFVTAKPKGINHGIDFEHTGQVRRIDSKAITQQLDQGNIVLLSNIGSSPSGELFNLSAEDVAQQTTTALQADKLITFSFHCGLQDPQGRRISEIKPEQGQAFLQTLKPDDDHQRELSRLLSCTIAATQAGTPRCHLLSYQVDGALLNELFTRDGIGTQLSCASSAQTRQAQTDDVASIIELIEPLEAAGLLVKRDRDLIERQINQYSVIEIDGTLIACAALHPHPEQRCGELACVATHAEYRNQNLAEKLLLRIEQQAQSQGLQYIFALTTQSSHWFLEHGFKKAGIEQLPSSKRSTYNSSRNSQILRKALD